MTTAITRLAKEVRDEYYPVDFDERLDRLAKIVLEMEKALDGLQARHEWITEPRLRNWRDVVQVMCGEASVAWARCQQIASEGK